MKTEINLCNPGRPVWKRWTREIVVMAIITVVSAFVFGSFYVREWTWSAYRTALVIALVFGIVMRLLPGQLAPWLIARLIPSRMPRSAKTVFIMAGVYALSGLIGTYLALTLSGWIFHFDFFQSWKAVYIQLFIGLIMTLLVAVTVYGGMAYRELVARTREAEEARKAALVAELRALRAQVNPHFLFNTLNSISALIAIDPKLADRVVQKLADIFRYVLIASDKETVTLAEELEFVRNYLEIEKIRFDDRLKISIRSETGTESVPVPSLILQPIVENAIKHGASNDTNVSSIDISAAWQNGHLAIHVVDSGANISGIPQGLGMGLRNVQERLHKTYGPSAVVQLTPQASGGTRVELRIPIRRDADA